MNIFKYFPQFSQNQFLHIFYIVETIPAIDFIQRLIRHIPKKHFKMIRYGGLYARHREIDKTLFRAISENKHRIYRSFNQWRNAILLSFGYDPLECPICKHKMELLELYYKHKRVPLEELYEKTMSKFLGKRSSAWSLFNIYDIILCKDETIKTNIEELRKKYMNNPPEGLTSKDIRNMSEAELLDMDYFLNEDDLFADEAGVEGFYIF